MENLFIDGRSFYLFISLIPAADKVDHDVTGAGNHKEPKQVLIWNIVLDTIKDILRQIHEEKYIENLLNCIFKQRKNKEGFVRPPYLF